MRAYIFPLLFLLPLMLVPAAPYTGVLLWGWVTMMNPHQIAGGWISAVPINMIVVVVLAAGLVLHREPMLPLVDSLTTMIVVFILWSIVTTLAALSPDISAARADLSIKSMIFGLVVAVTTRNRVRCQALVWIFVISYGYFGLKGGMFTIVTGGAGTVIGPPNTTIEDRNALALALLTTIPLAYFLYMTSSHRLTRVGLIVLMVLTAVAILGTYSRGGLVGLVFLLLYFWMKSTRKLRVAVCALTVGLAGLAVLPERWFDRMSSIDEANADDSFLGREDAWRFAINAASSRLLGVGFSGTEDVGVFQQYLQDPRATVGRGRAAHSIYFQVLGDHGFIGLGLYLGILLLAWRKAGQLAKTKDEDSEWMSDFGRMARVSLATYCVTGVALSMAYDSSFFCLLGLLSAVGRLAPERRPRRVSKCRYGPVCG
jgi:probable O-glycosylation ligase (exosortase A-associated)